MIRDYVHHAAAIDDVMGVEVPFALVAIAPQEDEVRRTLFASALRAAPTVTIRGIRMYANIAVWPHLQWNCWKEMLWREELEASSS